MNKLTRTIAVLIILSPVILCFGFCGEWQLKRSSLQAAYDSIQIGDTRQKVLETMGSPSEAEPCFQESKCTSLYYGVLFERWIVYVDSNDKVTYKVSHEGLF